MSCDLLVGSTGFVGGNLMASHTFDAAYHSTDVAEGFGCSNELVVYAGVPAAMFLANQDPAADLAVMAAARALAQEVDFIGCHPMAGREVSGIDHAEATLFRNAHFIMTPRPESTPEHIALLERMAAHCGFRDTVRTTPEHHDAVIAYTSQLMHIVAVAVCDDPDLFDCRGYEGGSFRDCTRVAALDVPLWTELFSMNAPALAAVIERLEARLGDYRRIIEAGDREALSHMLARAADRKRQMNIETRRGDDAG